MVRDRLLEAAAHVYAEHGFRGATTRRIAAAAGVNEVTLFRLFGSKAALIAEALRAHAARLAPAALPDEPVDPEAELSAWCAGQIGHLRAARAMIRKTMGELEERPELTPCATHAPVHAARDLRAYLARLRERGLIARDVDITAASAMLLGALFADAMGRDMMPDLYPRTADAPRAYAALLLRAIGATGAAPRRSARAARGAKPAGRAPRRSARG